jgi:hypothetical protein
MLQRMFWPQPLACIFLLCAGLSATDTLTMTDGTHHNGTLVSATSTGITFRERKTLHHYPKSSVQSIEMNTGVESSPALSRSERASGSANNVELPAGTEIAVLANQTIDSSTATAGQIFPADVAENVMDAQGRVVIPKGSLAELILRSASRGGVTSNAEMALDLQSIKVGNGGAVLGTLIGAIARGRQGRRHRSSCGSWSRGRDTSAHSW